MHVSETARPARRLSAWTYLKDGRAELEEYFDKYDLNATATAIWLRCDGRHSLSEIVDELAAAFPAERSEIADDTLRFVQELVDYQLVTLADYSGSVS
jgi:coenzyme PQQ biosynthesis protein PqqD